MIGLRKIRTVLRKKNNKEERASSRKETGSRPDRVNQVDGHEKMLMKDWGESRKRKGGAVGISQEQAQKNLGFK